MLAKVCSAAVNGIEAFPVEVEVNAGWGDTLTVIVGLPDAAVKESRDRVSTALSNSGFKFPMGRTTINLAPADVKKEGPSFDLPIAIGILAASEQMQTERLADFVIVGELALTGGVRPVKGVPPIALRARAEARTDLLMRAGNAPEEAVVTGVFYANRSCRRAGRRSKPSRRRHGHPDNGSPRFQRRSKSRQNRPMRKDGSAAIMGASDGGGVWGA
jgi:magnesium chelatase family protein